MYCSTKCGYVLLALQLLQAGCYRQGREVSVAPIQIERTIQTSGDDSPATSPTTGLVETAQRGFAEMVAIASLGGTFVSDFGRLPRTTHEFAQYVQEHGIDAIITEAVFTQANDGSVHLRLTVQRPGGESHFEGTVALRKRAQE